MDLQYTRSYYRILAESVPVGIADMPTEAADATSRMHNTHIIVVVVEIRRAKLEFIIGSINHPVGTGIPIDADVTTWL